MSAKQAARCTPHTESAAALQAVLAGGRAPAVGCSNYPAGELSLALEAGAPFSVIESNYNLAAREIETGVIPVARRTGIGLITYSPLAAGFLMGKYTLDRGAIPKGSRFDVIPGHADTYFKPENFAAAARLQNVAAEANVPAAQLATAWVLRNTAVDVVLPGARETTHLDNALAAARLANSDLASPGTRERVMTGKEPGQL